MSAKRENSYGVEKFEIERAARAMRARAPALPVLVCLFLLYNFLGKATDYKGGARIHHAAALDLLPRSERRMTDAYQIWQRLSGGRTIASPSLHWKACANKGMFDSGPFTRKRPSGCESVTTSCRSISGRTFCAQIWA